VLGADEIILRLAGAAPERRLAPPDTMGAITYWFEVVAGLHAAFGVLLYAEVFLPAHARRTPERREAALARIHDPATRARTAHLVEHGVAAARRVTCLDAVSAAFAAADLQLAAHPWLTGPEFSLADVALFPYVHTPMRLVSDLWFDRLPNLARWLGQMRARAAFAEAILNHPYPEELWAAVLAAPTGGGFRPA